MELAQEGETFALTLMGDGTKESFQAIARYAKKRREELGYTPKQFSALASAQLCSYLEIENGTFECVQIRTIQRVLRALQNTTGRRGKYLAHATQKQLSKLLKDFRTKHSVSRAEFAKHAGISDMCLSYFEASDTKEQPTLLRPATIDRIFRVIEKFEAHMEEGRIENKEAV